MLKFAAVQTDNLKQIYMAPYSNVDLILEYFKSLDLNRYHISSVMTKYLLFGWMLHRLPMSSIIICKKYFMNLH